MAQPIMTWQSRLTLLFGDREYFSKLVKIALPMTFQNLIMSSLNMVSVIFIGQLGETSLAAVGLANQVFFLLQLTLFGVFSGAGIYAAQLWGQKNLFGIHKVLGVSLTIGVFVALFFMLASILMPRNILSIYTEDIVVIELGAQYLRRLAFSFLFVAVTFCYAAILRSAGEVKVPVLVSTTALGINTFLSYVLIFGRLGMPEMGVNGAAISGIATRCIECFGLLFFVYRLKLPAAASLWQMYGFSKAFFGRVLKPIIPVTLQEIFWSLGVTTYNIIYARIGTEAIAAMNIVGTIDMIGMVTFFAAGTACAVLVGNLIGAGEFDKAYLYAGWSLRFVVVAGICVGFIVLLFSPNILQLYKVSPQVLENASNVLIVLSGLIWLRAANVILLIGILRSGGDTRFSLFLETGSMWGVGVAAAAIGAFVFNLPIYLVYALAMLDELTKSIIAWWRYRSRLWIHDMAKGI
jgi:putative MATE family efflux protein